MISIHESTSQEAALKQLSPFDNRYKNQESWIDLLEIRNPSDAILTLLNQYIFKIKSLIYEASALHPILLTAQSVLLFTPLTNYEDVLEYLPEQRQLSFVFTSEQQIQITQSQFSESFDYFVGSDFYEVEQLQSLQFPHYEEITHCTFAKLSPNLRDLSFCNAVFEQKAMVALLQIVEDSNLEKLLVFGVNVGNKTELCRLVNRVFKLSKLQELHVNGFAIRKVAFHVDIPKPNFLMQEVLDNQGQMISAQNIQYQFLATDLVHQTTTFPKGHRVEEVLSFLPSEVSESFSGFSFDDQDESLEERSEAENKPLVMMKTDIGDYGYNLDQNVENLIFTQQQDMEECNQDSEHNTDEARINDVSDYTQKLQSINIPENKVNVDDLYRIVLKKGIIIRYLDEEENRLLQVSDNNLLISQPIDVTTFNGVVENQLTICVRDVLHIDAGQRTAEFHQKGMIDYKDKLSGTIEYQTKDGSRFLNILIQQFSIDYGFDVVFEDLIQILVDSPFSRSEKYLYPLTALKYFELSEIQRQQGVVV